MSVILTPDSGCPGAPLPGPVGTGGQRHDPRVPTAGGVPPWCSCGWKQPTPRGPFLYEHLRDVRGSR
jgi:hypothetical protein